MTIEKRQETNGITIGCVFIGQFMVHSTICVSDQPGITFRSETQFGKRSIATSFFEEWFIQLLSMYAMFHNNPILVTFLCSTFQFYTTTLAMFLSSV